MNGTVINGQLPGPTIEADWGDTIRTIAPVSSILRLHARGLPDFTIRHNSPQQLDESQWDINPLAWDTAVRDKLVGRRPRRNAMSD